MQLALDRRIRERVNHCCEYCQLPQVAYKLRFPIDHIIALQHGGETKAANPCLACPRCNASEGPNIAGLDPLTKKIFSLFNPRRHKWRTHFRWDGAQLIGKTPIGRATISVLAINDVGAVAARAALIDEGRFPSVDH